LSPEDFTKRVFDETHSLVENEGAKCQALGFSVGSIVHAAKKIEVEVVHGRHRERHLKQVKKGQEGKVVELGKDTLKVQFTVEVNNKEHVVMKEVPLSAVEKPEAPEQPDQGDPTVLGPPLPPGHEWARMPCKEVSVVQWPTKPEKDPSQKVHTLKSSIGFIMGAMAENMPSYDGDDFAIIFRDRVTEVWTKKQFAAGTITLSPECTELKDPMPQLCIF
jgi:hypothetical protein